MKRTILKCVAAVLMFALTVFTVDCAATKTQLKADLIAAVDCAKVDPANVTIVAATKTCILDVAAGQEQLCLAQFAPFAVWSTDEIQCIASKTTGVVNDAATAAKTAPTGTVSTGSVTTVNVSIDAGGN